MLELWRARQQEDMRIAQFCGNSMMLYPFSSGREGQPNISYQFQPYPGSSYYASRDCVIFDGKSPRLIRKNKQDESTSRNSALLQRTEKLINTPSRESRESPRKHFMSQMLKNSRSLAYDDVTSKEFAYRTLDPKKGRSSKAKLKHSGSSKAKKSTTVPSLMVSQPQNNCMGSTCSLASHFRNPKAMGNNFYSQSMVNEIHSLFETGELPSKRWKEKYKLKRK